MPAPLEMYDSLSPPQEEVSYSLISFINLRRIFRSLEIFKGSWCICITNIELKSFDIKLTIKKKSTHNAQYSV